MLFSVRRKKILPYLEQTMKLPSCDSPQNHSKFRLKLAGQHCHPSILGILGVWWHGGRAVWQKLLAASRSLAHTGIFTCSHWMYKCLCLCTLQLGSLETAFQSNHLSSEFLKSCCLRICFEAGLAHGKPTFTDDITCPDCVCPVSSLGKYTWCNGITITHISYMMQNTWQIHHSNIATAWTLSLSF